MKLNAGSLVHKVTIQTLTDGEDTSGAPIESGSTLLTAKMARTTDQGDERYASDQQTARIITRWTMRYHPLMDPDLVDVPKKRRLVYKGRAYDITAADTIDRKAGIVLETLASSKVAA